MIKAVATAVETAEHTAGQAPVQPLYLEALTLVERLHRRLLDVIKDEFDRRGRADINSVQALLLYNIGDKELTAGELRTRGYYLGSNASYNLKNMVDGGYVERQSSVRDRRSARLKLSVKGRNILALLIKLNVQMAESLIKNEEHGLEATSRTLHYLERRWTEAIRSESPSDSTDF